MSGINITYTEVIQNIAVSETAVTIAFAETVAVINTGGGGGGSGDVVGPASAVTNRIAAFNGTTGKLIKDGGKTIAEVLSTDNHTDGTTNKVYSASDKTRLANTSGTNTGDQDLSSYATKAYADALVVGLIDDRGNYNASVNTFPASGGSGTAGAVLKGDLWTVSVAGTLGGHAVTAGDLVRALVDSPGQTDSNWAITENNIGYVAENASNKDTDSTFAANSDTKYPSQKAVKTALETKQDSLGFTAENVSNKDTDGTLSSNSDTKYPSQKAVKTYADTKLAKASVPCEFIIACSDLTTALTSGTGKAYFRAPYAFTLTAVRASLLTAQTSGSIFTVDINESGTTVISTKLTIDNTEKTSQTAATAAVISDSAIADDAEITIDIDQVGDGTAKGLIVTLIGTHAV